MARFVCDTLATWGLEPILAWYEPYSQLPELSIPVHMWRPGRRIGSRAERVFDQYEGYSLGAWLPELEFTHYRATELWRELIDSCCYHMVVSGNCLAGSAYAELGIPFISWVATPWSADRIDRVSHFPWPRRMLDRLVSTPIIRRIERNILNAGTILALSRYTQNELKQIGGKAPQGVLPMPVNDELFHPQPGRVVEGRVGFSGRYSDPRKNIDLLLQGVAEARKRGSPVSLDLIGENKTGFLSDRLRELGLHEVTRIHPYLARERLPDLLQELDLFVIPSHQEGLCISALEAMASGCPVISTRCGGPEEYVIDGSTGYLVDAVPIALAEVLARVVGDRPLRMHLSAGARGEVVQNYSLAVAQDRLLDAFNTTYREAIA